MPLAAGTVITVDAADLAQYTFVGSPASSLDRLQIRAFDGTSWSAPDNATWAPFNAGPPIDNAPVVTTTNKSASRGQSFSLASLA